MKVVVGWRRWASVLLLCAVSGCAGGPTGLLPDVVDVDPPSAPAPATAAECPRDGVGLGAFVDDGFPDAAVGLVPEGFRAVEALHCTIADVQPFPPLISVTERRSDVTPALLTALALPDQGLAPFSNLACPAIYHPPTLLILLDEVGQAIAVRQPADVCSEPRAEVAETIAALPTTEVGSYTFDPAY